MFCRITTHRDGPPKTYIGHVIHWGPRSLMMLLTEPSHSAGETVLIPIDHVLLDEKLAAEDRTPSPKS